jgi:hypothetical protein
MTPSSRVRTVSTGVRKGSRRSGSSVGEQLQELRRGAAPPGRHARRLGGGVGAALDLVLQGVGDQERGVLAVLERGLAQEARDVAGLEDPEACEEEDRQADAQDRERDEAPADGRDGGMKEWGEASLDHGSDEATTPATRAPKGTSS